MLMAAALSYLGNRSLYRAMGARGIVVGVPVWEESCKAVMILILPGDPVALVHLLFGALEFALSASTGSKSSIALGAVSMATHVLTGVLVATVVNLGHNLWLGYLLAIGLHLGLNASVVKLVLPGLVWGERDRRVDPPRGASV